MTTKITPDQQVVIDHIKRMEHKEMCKLWRYAPIGHPFFRTKLPYFKVFEERLFKHFKGFTPEISKEIAEEHIKEGGSCEDAIR